MLPYLALQDCFVFYPFSRDGLPLADELRRIFQSHLFEFNMVVPFSMPAFLLRRHVAAATNACMAKPGVETLHVIRWQQAASVCRPISCWIFPSSFFLSAAFSQLAFQPER
jgi:hypothetical protein